jgi:hypothetical protein
VLEGLRLIVSITRSKNRWTLFVVDLQSIQSKTTLLPLQIEPLSSSLRLTLFPWSPWFPVPFRTSLVSSWQPSNLYTAFYSEWLPGPDPKRTGVRTRSSPGQDLAARVGELRCETQGEVSLNGLRHHLWRYVLPMHTPPSLSSPWQSDDSLEQPRTITLEVRGLGSSMTKRRLKY